MLHHEGLQRTNPIGKTPFAEEHGSETHEYLVQLAWQQFVLTEGQCWSLVLVEAQKSPDPLDCCGAAPGPALSPVMSMRQWGRGLAGVAGGCGTAAAAVAGGVGEERAGVPLVLDQLVQHTQDELTECLQVYLHSQMQAYGL